ncbi:MAG: hypothetical protein JXA71_01355, partial [Chitinispirillaceae bacterium]|nr:hypothetical protein [Chitinispirillaceae bacterium]
FARYLSHEQLRRELESQLVRANEMKMLGQLTSGVAHEVRNPLNGIMAIVGALVKELGDAERFEPYLHHLRSQVTRLTTLMEDLLALGRPIRDEKKVVLPVIALVQNALLPWQLGQKQRGKVLFTPPEAGMGEILIKADAASIEQVLINLLENACQHAGLEKEVALSIDTEGPDALRIMVRDQGPGIPEEMLSRIFEPFFTTRKGGTGLGLSIVRHIVESHGGSISARNNEEGDGSTFTITLPLSGSKG